MNLPAVQAALAEFIAAATKLSVALTETSGSALAHLVEHEAVMDLAPEPSPPMPTPPLLLSQSEAARMLGLHCRTLQRMRAAHEGPKAILIGGRVRYRRSDLERWVEGKRS